MKNWYQKQKSSLHRITMRILLGSWVGVSKLIRSDRIFLSVFYLLKMKEKMNWKAPENYCQKLQWLKLHNTDSLYSVLVDKYRVKQYVATLIGDEYVIPLLGVWDSVQEVQLDELPAKFVLKTTHDSGNVLICRNKATLDWDAFSTQYSHALSTNYFYKSREYPYKYAQPRIIAEQLMEDPGKEDLSDFKFFCFHGEPRFVQITRTVEGQKQQCYFDMDLKIMPFTTEGSVMFAYRKPVRFDEMVALARLLSKGIIHVRVDLYLIDNQVFFGEFTFHNNGGIVHFHPAEWNKIIGEWIHIE